ncbi:MAG: DUF2291 family protein [Alistipes sp.]|nr:DUF2291 family protein [Alistipes sp.]
MKKSLQWSIRILILAVVIALSIKIEPLDQRSTQHFDPARQIEEFWQERLPSLLQGDRVLDADLFRTELKNNRKLLVDRYGSTLGIGAPYSLLLGGEFEVFEVGEELIHIRTEQGAAFDLRTDYIFGNTVREATASFSIDDYENTMDFNLVASELNRRVLQLVVAPVRDQLVKGARLHLIGAVDLPQEGLPKGYFELIPLTIELR